MKKKKQWLKSECIKWLFFTQNLFFIINTGEQQRINAKETICKYSVGSSESKKQTNKIRVRICDQDIWKQKLVLQFKRLIQISSFWVWA